MYKFELLTCLGILLIIAECIVLYALKRNIKLFIWQLAFVLVILCFYWCFGGLKLINQYYKKQFIEQHAQQLLIKFKNPQKLIQRLQAQLSKEPSSAYGWYLLGKLYSSQNQFKLAVNAFQHSYKLQPNYEKYAVQYLLTLWDQNKQQQNAKISNLLQLILQHNQRQPDALAIAAISAYKNHNNKLAIFYWEKLLSLVDSNSKIARNIQQAIALAHRKII